MLDGAVRYILNFLRTGSLLVPEDALIRKELQIEAEFYQIPTLIDLLAHPVSLLIHSRVCLYGLLDSRALSLSLSSTP
jgi:hypothetical protein